MIGILLLKVTLIAVIGRLVIAAMPRGTAALRFAIAMMTLAATLLLPAIALSPLRIGIPVREAPAVSPVSFAAEGSGMAAAEGVSQPDVAVARLDERVDWRALLLQIYGVVAIFAFARFAIGILTVCAVVRRAEHVDDDAIAGELRSAAAMLDTEVPELLLSGRTAVPLMWGIRRPVLILPAAALDWTAGRLRVVFLHELAHWRRRDVGALLLMRGAAVLYWFHPVIWSLERIARRECERACDDVVLSAGTRATEYADHLLAIARVMPESEPFGAVTAAMSRPAELEGRLIAILQERIRRGISASAFAAVAMAMLVIAVPLGAARITEAESKMDRDVRLGVLRSIEDGVRGGVKGGVEGGVEGGVKQGVDKVVEEWAAKGAIDLRNGRLDEAIEALSNAVRANPYHGSARYNLACAYALRGDRDLALRTLRDAVLNGYGDADHIRRDDDLESIRGPELDAIADLADNLILGEYGGDWRSTIPRYERFANDHPDMPRAWFNLGFVLLGAGETQRSVEVFKRVLQMNYRPGTTMYNLACGYARLGDRETALQWLRRAADAGFDVRGNAAGDPDLASVRNDPWLASLIAQKKDKR